MIQLTDRDRDILGVLTCRVRALALEQITAAWWPSSQVRTANERLRALADEALLLLESHPTRELLDLVEPLATWQPGLPRPDLATAAKTATNRWRQPPRLACSAVATAEAAILVGGRGGRAPRETEWTHDLHLAGVYLRMRRELPTRAHTWQHEDMVPRPRESAMGEKLPDAIVTDGLHQTAIELVGSSYGVSKLETFHGYCARERLPYELW